MNPELRFLEVSGRTIACSMRHGVGPTLVFFPGYASNMEGAKAVALDQFAERRCLAMLRFDYSGTGSSGGTFIEGTLGRWIEDSLAAIDQMTAGPLMLIGSSMGVWIALHVALRRSTRVHSLVGISSAPDFTRWACTNAQHPALEYDHWRQAPIPEREHCEVLTRTFCESAEEYLLLDREIAIDQPVRLIHGELDREVPLAQPLRLIHALRSADVQLNIIKGAGHRLSAPNELGALLRMVANLVEPMP